MKRYKVQILTVVLLFILIGFFFFHPIKSLFETLSDYFYPFENNGKAEFLKIILSVIGALGILWGILISLRRAKALEKGVFNQTKQLELTRKSQIDERFKNAVEHLGSDKEPIILGGIAELYQIAKENKDNYGEIVFNIFCSYVRSEAATSKKEILRTPIQTIFDYIFRNRSHNTFPFPDLIANFGGTNLEGIVLDNMDLSSVNLSSCRLPALKNVNLEFAVLDRAIFKVYSITNVKFNQASMLFTQFRIISEIENCEFNGMKNFSSCDFFGCNFNECNFLSTEFSSINFIACMLKKCKFNDARFITGSFALSHLEDLNLEAVSLFGSVDMRGVSMKNVDLYPYSTMCDLSGATFSNRFLAGLYENRIDEILNEPMDPEVRNRFGHLLKFRIDIFTETDKNEIMKLIDRIRKLDTKNSDVSN